MIDVVIIGGGGNSIEIAEAIEACNEKERKHNILGFLDDNKEIWGSSITGYKVLGPLQKAKVFNGKTKFINGIGNYVSFRKRKYIFENIGLSLERFISIIHPSAYVSERATIGLGVVIFQNCTIGIDVHIGNHVIILPNSTIQHNS
ncbi:MAG: sugar O-acyltransferase, partial [Thermodesulfobacteriota bacterium]